MSENNNQLLVNLSSILTAENLQRYILGYKSNGNPRAAYDIVKDFSKRGKKKKKHKKHNKKKNGSAYELYVTAKKGKNKHWHI